MRKAGGYAQQFNELGTIKECDTFTCFHCNTVVHVNPKIRPEDMGGFCKICEKLICGHCVDKGSCTPFEKKLEAYERKDRLKRSVHQ